MIIYHFASTPSQSCPTGQIINKEYGICGKFDFSLQEVHGHF